MRAEKIRDRPARSKRIWRLVPFLALLGGCAGILEAPPPEYVPGPRDAWSGVSLSGRTIEDLAMAADAASERLAGSGLPVDAMRRILRESRSPGDATEKIARAFDLWAAGATAGEVLVTGYYEPVVAGSLAPSDGHRWPLYALPDDLVTVLIPPFGLTNASRGRLVGRLDGRNVVPYHTRREIDGADALSGKGLELAWLADPVERFFLHVQGSGVVRLPDGSERRVGYAGSNRYPYRSIGRLLADEGKIPLSEVTMQTVKDYLAANPGERDRILDYNESYVFFRWTDGGPFGSLRAKLVPFASVAVDPRVYPPGSILLLETDIPSPEGAMRAFKGLVVAMDTGGAIKGAGRVDLFCGTGKDAGEIAGRLKSRGRLFLLYPKGKPPADGRALGS